MFRDEVSGSISNLNSSNNALAAAVCAVCSYHREGVPAGVPGIADRFACSQHPTMLPVSLHCCHCGATAVSSTALSASPQPISFARQAHLAHLLPPNRFAPQPTYSFSQTSPVSQFTLAPTLLQVPHQKNGMFSTTPQSQFTPMSTAQAPFNPFAQTVPSQTSAFFAQQPQAATVFASPSFRSPMTPSNVSPNVSPTRLNFSVLPPSDNSTASTTIPTFNSSVSQASPEALGASPDYDDLVATGATESMASANSQQGNLKKMKTASKVSQFYTTIVIKVCLYVRENHRVCDQYRRSCIIFNRVERALRDRSLYPLPADVSQTDLLAYSFFKGPDAESEFTRYCNSDTYPLEEPMTDLAGRLYNNKFTDAKKMMTNHVLPKYLSIVKQITGNGTKSGQALHSSCCFFSSSHMYSGSMSPLKQFCLKQIEFCMRCDEQFL